MKIKCLVALLIVATLFGCTTVNVSKVDMDNNQISHLCILESTRSNTRDFISAMQERFEYHNISAESYMINKPDNCDAIVTFEAYRSYDPIPFLNKAKIELKRGNEVIGSVTYKHKGSVMSLDPGKYGSTRSKVFPMIDKLLGKSESDNT